MLDTLAFGEKMLAIDTESYLKLSNEEKQLDGTEIEIKELFGRAIAEMTANGEALQYGRQMKHQCFHLEKGNVFLNYGSFGATPRLVHSAAQVWQYKLERQPVRFMTRTVVPQMVNTLHEIAQFVNCHASELVFVPNASTGVNTIMNSIKFAPNSKIIALNLLYDAVYKTIQHHCALSGAECILVDIRFPVTSPEQIVYKFRETLDQHSDASISLCVLDHITSKTALVIPVKEITQLCHERGIPVLCDGAHALGQIPLDLHSLGCDYYVSNAHKWLFAPKGAAILYVSKSVANRDSIHPLTISHGYSHGWQSEFLWTGTMDFSAYLSISACLHFIGLVESHVTNENNAQAVAELSNTQTSHRPLGSIIMQRNHALARQGAELLSAKWGTEMLVNDDRLFASMAVVRIPYKQNCEATWDDVRYLHDVLAEQYNIETQLVIIEEKPYIRISAQIFNELADYQAVADAMLEVIRCAQERK